VLSGRDPSEVAAGLSALKDYLKEKAWFYTFATQSDKFPSKEYPAFFPHVIPSVGRYLAELASVPEGSALAYLIACPMEASIAIDAALKGARVELVKFFAPPTETNFAGALLSGPQFECEQAARAFVEKIETLI
jgi:ethanolamine utilization protein EutL